MKRRECRLTALCIGGGIGAMLLSLFVCMMIFDIRPDETPVSAPVTTALPYDSTQPFSAGDLTSTQMNDLRANGSRISVKMDPRGVSIGDSLDMPLSRYPSTYTNSETTGDLTGEQSNEEMIPIVRNTSRIKRRDDRPAGRVGRSPSIPARSS